MKSKEYISLQKMIEYINKKQKRAFPQLEECSFCFNCCSLGLGQMKRKGI